MGTEEVRQPARTTTRLSTAVIAAGLIVPLVVLQTALAETRIALVIGNGAYEEGSLDNPPRDAQLMADTLHDLGFTVTMTQNVNQKTMKRLIATFGDRLRQTSDAIGFFYYSGHGMQVKGRNYMIPVDANIKHEPDVGIDGVPIWSVLTRMEYARTVMSIIVLDACRNNPFEKRVKSLQEGIGLSPMRAPAGTLIAYATASGDVADPGPRGGYSPFTKILAEELRTSDATILQVFNSVSAQVYDRTTSEQTPYVEFTAVPAVALQLRASRRQGPEQQGPEKQAPRRRVAALPNKLAGKIVQKFEDYNYVLIALEERLYAGDHVYTTTSHGEVVRMRVAEVDSSILHASAIPETDIDQIVTGSMVYVHD